jgi:hypothetical protein
MSENNRAPEKRVRHIRQILLWPLQLMPIRAGAQVQKHWEVHRRSHRVQGAALHRVRPVLGLSQH